MKFQTIAVLSIIGFAAAPVQANPTVMANLNAADVLTREGFDPCGSVAIAAMAASMPEVWGPTSYDLKKEVAVYAKRCNVRF